MEALSILSNNLAAALRSARLAIDLEQSRQVIARSERLSAIGTLAAGLAHEIRNPLVSIRTFTQLLPERLDDPEFRSRFLELTLSEVDRICALVTELLAFARPAPATLETHGRQRLRRATLHAALEPGAEPRRVPLDVRAGERRLRWSPTKTK